MPKIGRTRSSDGSFTNSDFGKEVRLEQHSNEVRLIFVAGTQAKADALVENLLARLKAGPLNITLMSKATSITED
jgi:hypothetical protein